MLTIVTALPWEAERFAARLRGPRLRALGEGWAVTGERDGVVLRLLVSGPGEARVRQAAPALEALDPPLTGMLAVGVAGGLHPGLRPGDVVLAERVQHWRRTGRRASPPIATDARLSAFVAEALERCGARWRRGDSLTVDAALAAAREKAEWGAASGTVIAQMEDSFWAEAADHLGIPFAAARAVIDPVGQSVPAAVLEWDWRGPGAGTVARALVRRPGMVVALGRLARQRQSAVRSIDRMLEALVAQSRASGGAGGRP